MYELELSDEIELEEELPNFDNPLEQNRFWVYKTTYQGKISYIVVDMYDKKRYLFHDDASSNLGSIFILEEGEIFDIEYIADFNDWNLFTNKFNDQSFLKMANIISIIITADIEREEENQG
jgi:hypothetical protein